MKKLPILILLFVSLLSAEEPAPSIESEDGWTMMKFKTADKLKIDYVYLKDGTIILSIFHLFDRKTEKPVTFSENLEVEGARIEDLSNPPMQIGYRTGNLEFAQSICLIIPDDPASKQIELPKHVFSHIPDYWPFVLPYPVVLPQVGVSPPNGQP